MSFLTTTRIFNKPVRPTQWGGYMFDLLLLLFLWLAYLGYQDLQALSGGAPHVTIPASAFAFFGGLGVYGIRVAMYIAMIRRNRSPQTAEWLAFIIPLCLALPCFVASGMLVRLYAGAHDYRTCFRQGGRAATYTFAAANAACPRLPPDAQPY